MWILRKSRQRGRRPLERKEHHAKFTVTMQVHPTEEQLIQREKFSAVIKFLTPLKSIVASTWSKNSGISPFTTWPRPTILRKLSFKMPGCM